MFTQSAPSLSPADRSPQCTRAALVAAVLAAAFAGNARADDYLEPIGGPGGGQFSARCSDGEFLIGVALRRGDDVDAIRPLCASADGVRDAAAAARGDWHGGPGGSATNILCADRDPFVNGMLMSFEGANTGIVNDIALTCGPQAGRQDNAGGPAMNEAEERGRGLQHCPRGQIGVGLHGRSGLMLDAVGLICGAPPPPAKTIGRVNTGKSPPRPPGWTICDSARDARGRNSPAAPNLEAQCAKLPGKSIGRVTPTGTTSPALPPPATPALPPPESQAPPVESDANADKRASRDAALRELMGSLVAGINKSRQTVRHPSPRGPSDAVSGRHVDSANGGRHDDRYPPVEQSTAEFDQGADPQTQSQPENSIRIEVQYPAIYGYKDAAGTLDSGPNSCSAFYISALPASRTRPRKLTEINTQPHMRSGNDRYVCEYLILDQSLDQPLLVRVAMSDERAAGSAIWLDGDQAQPPAGERRTIADSVRQVTLTADQPRASLSFEMTYSGSP